MLRTVIEWQDVRESLPPVGLLGACWVICGIREKPETWWLWRACCDWEGKAIYWWDPDGARSMTDEIIYWGTSDGNVATAVAPIWYEETIRADNENRVAAGG